MSGFGVNLSITMCGVSLVALMVQQSNEEISWRGIGDDGTAYASGWIDRNAMQPQINQCDWKFSEFCSVLYKEEVFTWLCGVWCAPGVVLLLICCKPLSGFLISDHAIYGMCNMSYASTALCSLKVTDGGETQKYVCFSYTDFSLRDCWIFVQNGESGKKLFDFDCECRTLKPDGYIWYFRQTSLL